MRWAFLLVAVSASKRPSWDDLFRPAFVWPCKASDVQVGVHRGRLTYMRWVTLCECSATGASSSTGLRQHLQILGRLQPQVRLLCGCEQYKDAHVVDLGLSCVRAPI